LSPLFVLNALLACTSGTGAGADSAATDNGQADAGAEGDGGARDSGQAQDSGSDGGAAGDGGGGDGDGGDTGDCPDPLTWYYDADGDGFGDEALWVQTCDAPMGYVAEAGDCDDIDPRTAPRADDPCGDGRDQDCDGSDSTCALPASGDLRAVAYAVYGTTLNEDDNQCMGIGDMDGDGQADILLGDSEDSLGDGVARLYLGPFASDRSDGSEDARVRGGTDGAFAALGTASLLPGDLDGDGLPDVVIGAGRFDTGRVGGGGVWIVPGPIAGDIDPSVTGTLYEHPTGAGTVGYSLGSGDLTGDGLTDLAIGSSSDGASTWIVAGPLTAGGVLGAVGREVIQSDATRSPARSLATADLDGDGIHDLILGRSGDDNATIIGQVYILAGPVRDGTDVAEADFKLEGEVAGDRLGWSLSTTDLDGDGLPDLIAGAPSASLTGSYSGAVYGVLAPLDRGDIGAADADHRLLGTEDCVYFGIGVATPDLDGDGEADLATACFDKVSFTGNVNLFRGGLPTSATVDDSDAWWTGDAGVLAGWWLRSNGDLTGDGVDDLLVGEPGLKAPGNAWVLGLEAR
jgi:FG-GAP repeat